MARQLSIEDGNLSSSILSSRKKSYSDIDLLFERKPSGDIYSKTDADAVKQSVKNIVSTNHFEKPFEIFYGANITGMLFELADAGMGTHIEDQIKSSISEYEPRARVLKINVFSNPDRNTLQVELLFRVIATEQEVELKTTVSRLR
jgi:phage baseplate assembly protein W